MKQTEWGLKMETELIQKIKKLQLKILMELDRVCNKCGLEYYGAFGTVIGAIRHKGFIPWDDDIDVYMEWKDYKKLEDIASKELEDEFYFQSRKNNPENFVYWNRIGLKNTTSIDKNLAHIRADWGICIDIFPILPLGDSHTEIKKSMKYYRKINKYCLKYLMIKMPGGTWIENAKRGFHRFIPDGLSVWLTEYYMKKLASKDLWTVKYCTSGTGGYLLETEWFKRKMMVPFEDMEIPIMSGYDEYLKTIYGDYMELPPEDKRIGHINENIIVKTDEPYQKYYV